MRTTQRCLMCGSHLAFLKKIASGSFCSDEHRDKYHAQLDYIIFDRLKGERRRLLGNGSFAPAPLARYLRRGADSLPPLGSGLDRVVEPLPSYDLCVPQHATTLVQCLGEGAYLHGIAARRNPGLRTMLLHPRGIRRRWPKSPGLPRVITGLSSLCGPFSPMLQVRGPAPALLALAPIGFNREFALRWTTGLQSKGLPAVRQPIAVVQVVAPILRRDARESLAAITFIREFAMWRTTTGLRSGLAFSASTFGIPEPKALLRDAGSILAADLPRQFAMVAPRVNGAIETLGSKGLIRLEPKVAAPDGCSLDPGSLDFTRTAAIGALHVPSPRLAAAGRNVIETPVSVRLPKLRQLAAAAPQQFGGTAPYPTLQPAEIRLRIAQTAGLVRSQRIPAPHAPAGLENVMATGTPASFEPAVQVSGFGTVSPRGMRPWGLVAALPPSPVASPARGIDSIAPVTEAQPQLPASSIGCAHEVLQYAASVSHVRMPEGANRRIEIVVDPAAAVFERAVVMGSLHRNGTGIGQLLPIRCTAVVPGAPKRRPHIGMVAMRLRPIMPRLRLEPDVFRRPRVDQETVVIPSAAWQMPTWKRLSIGVPVIAILIAFYLSMDRSNVSQARAESSMIGDVMGNMRRDLSGRAAVNLTEAFDSGLTNWTGGDGWQNSWKSKAGEAFPASLAVLTASVPLRNYTAEFNAQPSKKALSFVVRARDLDNYYAARFVITKPGLLPEVMFERYAVVAGEELQRVRTPLHMPLGHDSVYRVRVEARDNDFAVYLNDTIVDSWSDDRFPTGGIGFFAKKGESARIAGVHVWHQDDTVGRLLAHISKDDGTRSR
jgi:hypothetical protein